MGDLSEERVETRTRSGFAPEVLRWNRAEHHRRKLAVALVFVTAVAVLGTSLAFMLRADQAWHLAVARMATGRLVMDRLDETRFSLADAESAARGYLLAGEAPYLARYRKAVSEIDSRVAELRGFGAKGLLPREQVAGVAQFVRETLAELDRAIHVRQERGMEAAVALERSAGGLRLMEGTRSGIGPLRAGAQADFAEATERAHRARVLRTVMYVMGGLLNLACLAWASQRIHRQLDTISRGKQLLATTLASIGDGVIVTDAQGQVRFLNAEAERLTGWNDSEAAGEPLPRVFNIINERTREVAENPVAKALRLGRAVGLANHTLLLRRDGSEIPIDDSAAPISQPDGPLFGVVLVFRDFTTQKHVEEQLEETVRERTAKLREMVAELEHVSYAMVHDMRAPLRAMQAFAQMLKEEAAQRRTKERIEHANRIITAAQRMDRLIQDALTYNKAVLDEPRLEPVDLSRLLCGLVNTYPSLDASNADIQIESNLPIVIGNEALLTQCFSNLLDNAVKFVAPGTRPRVCVRGETQDGFARIWVEDNGTGIPPITQKRLFGLFQRLTTQSEGTGLGLAIVRKLTERMGGRVGAESEPGKGSRFWVELKTVEQMDPLVRDRARDYSASTVAC